VIRETARTITRASKHVLRKFVPDFLLRKRDIICRLGPKAGRIYARLSLLDMLRVRTANKRLVPRSARSFVFVCHGNIMRSAMAEFLMRQTLQEMGLEQQVHVTSAGLHACAGREAHIWARESSADLGISLADHRAKPFSKTMAAEADCILAMDFQNKAELLTLYPESREKIYMLSAYSEGPGRYREILDPYLGDLETTRFCARQLRTCVGNLIRSIFHNLQSSSNVRSQDPNIGIPFLSSK
jgi:protein-tyrosine-phosphatase